MSSPLYYYLDAQQKPAGPLTVEELSERLQRGEVSGATWVASEGGSRWVRLEEVMGLGRDSMLPRPNSPPPPVPQSWVMGQGQYAPPSYEPPLTGYSYATFIERVVANILDSLILFCPLAALSIGGLFLGFGSFFFALSGAAGTASGVAAPVLGVLGYLVAMGIIFVGSLVIRWIYEAYLESGPRQATYGKQIMGIKVVTSGGKPIDFARASGRHFSKYISHMVPLFLGYWIMIFTDHKQAVHDLIANTFVVKDRRASPG